MANKQINELSELTVASGTDLIAVYDLNEAGSERSKKMTINNMIKSSWTYTPAVNALGTDVTLTTSIPSWSTEVEIMISAVATNTSNQPAIVQLGDSGGVETSGYSSSAMFDTTGGGGNYHRTDCIPMFNAQGSAADNALTGVLRLSRYSTSSNLWIGVGFTTRADGDGLSSIGGSKELSGSLTTVKLTTPGGTATFDEGTARVRYR